MRVGVVGASGFLGGEAVRLLEMHPQAKAALACGGESAGKRLDQVRPGLISGPEVIESPEPERLEAECDAVILALPHGHSAPLAEELLKRGLTVIDLGSDFRLKDPAAVMKWYGREAPRQRLLDHAWYGLPEVAGPPPSGTKLIACPGCFATALGLLLAPLAPLQIPRLPVFGITGSSGSGIQPGPGVHHSLRTGDFKAYKPLKHQHMGELGQLLAAQGWTPQIDFVPHSAPFVRGIHLTALIEAPAGEVWDLYSSRYQGQPFISLHEGPVQTGPVAGSNRAAIGLVEEGGQCSLFIALDNLIKGGAGQGIQNLNLLQGWDQALGLPRNGTWP